LKGIPALALFSLFVVTGFRGVDFGKQWDEIEWHIQPVRDMVETGIFLPHLYIYPSLSKWLVLIPAVPAGIEAGRNTGLDSKAIKAAMKSIVDLPGHLLTARRVFIVVSGLSLIWIYAAALALRRPWWEAFIAAAALGLSWEFAYHARFVANDCLLTQFAALTVLLLALFHRSGQSVWVYGAAIAAGLGTGAKYPGVVLLLPVLVAGMVVARRPLVASVVRAVFLCGAAFGTYLVTTPGTFLDPYQFIRDTHRITGAYSAGHYGYTVAGPAAHWKVVLSYFAFSYFSPWKAASVLLFAAVIWGGVSWFRREWRVAVILVGFPLAFLSFFCGKYIVAIVRNYLFVVPFLALLAARGVADVAERLKNRWARGSFLAVCSALAIAQAIFLVRAAESIRHREDARGDARAAIEYVAAHPMTRFRVSPRVRDLIAAQHIALPANVTDGPTPDSVVFFAIADSTSPSRWKTNDPWLTQAVFGPREMNFNWYSTWAGQDRIVVMTLAKARESSVVAAR
jgi:hypothetical protein